MTDPRQLGALLDVKRRDEGSAQSALADAADRTARARAALATALEELADRQLARRTARAAEAEQRIATAEERLAARRWDVRLGAGVSRALERVRAAESALAGCERTESEARAALADAYRGREALERHLDRREDADRREAERREERRS